MDKVESRQHKHTGPVPEGERRERAEIIAQVGARNRRLEFESQYVGGVAPQGMTPEQIKSAPRGELFHMAVAPLPMVGEESDSQTSGDAVENAKNRARIEAIPIHQREKLRRLIGKVERAVESDPPDVRKAKLRALSEYLQRAG